jgi:Tfp pilus assembly protein PilV
MMKSQSNRKDHRNSRSGTTLVESMMAVLLLGGAIGGACHLAVSAKCVSDQSRAKYQAVNIARNQLERIRLVGYDQMGHWSESKVRVDSNGAANPKGHFQRTTSITVISPELTEARVVVDVMSRVTLTFDGGSEEISSLLTRFRSSAS